MYCIPGAKRRYNQVTKPEGTSQFSIPSVRDTKRSPKGKVTRLDNSLLTGILVLH